MADQDDQINIAGPTSGEKGMEDYRVSDVEQAYKDFSPSSWQDLINMLKEKGDSEWHLTPGEVKSMVADAEQADKNGDSFPDNPEDAYNEMHKYRGQSQSETEHQAM